jgi:hypothetical protein
VTEAHTIVNVDFYQYCVYGVVDEFDVAQRFPPRRLGAASLSAIE